jgi:hypothetical protein
MIFLTDHKTGPKNSIHKFLLWRKKNVSNEGSFRIEFKTSIRGKFFKQEQKIFQYKIQINDYIAINGDSGDDRCIILIFNKHIT